MTDITKGSNIRIRRELISVYIDILTDHYTTKIDYEELRSLLKKHFNFTVTLGEISENFEPTFEELQLDMEQHMKNTGIINV